MKNTKREIKFRTPTKCQNGHFRWYYYEADFGDVYKVGWGEKQADCKCPTGGLDNGFEKCGNDEQLTGLFDKDRKEIYEGDIVKVDAPTDKGSIYEIVWEDGVYRYFSHKTKVHYYFAQKAMAIFSEVIGNIHENKELLKK